MSNKLFELFKTNVTKLVSLGNLTPSSQTTTSLPWASFVAFESAWKENQRHYRSSTRHSRAIYRKTTLHQSSWLIHHHLNTFGTFQPIPSKTPTSQEKCYAAYMFKRLSLIENLLTGPDLLTDLIESIPRTRHWHLRRYRRHVYANHHSTRRSISLAFPLAGRRPRLSLSKHPFDIWCKLFPMLCQFRSPEMFLWQ